MPESTSSGLIYCGVPVDRCDSRRDEPTWADECRADPGATVVALWRDRCLLVGDLVQAGWSVHTGPDLVAAAGEVVVLGRGKTGPVFAADLSHLAETDALALAGAHRTADLRSVITTIDRDIAGTLGYAKGILHWHRNQRFCPTCGSATTSGAGGHRRRCAADDCGRLLFPRIEPAVIVLVETPGPRPRVLLARHRNGRADDWSTLAGFVEIGESLEDTVHRELREETGIEVRDVRYQASQAWPFPSGLMLGFRATCVESSVDDVRVDPAELAEARWFTPADLRSMIDRHVAAGTHRIDSIERHLVDGWLDEVG